MYQDQKLDEKQKVKEVTLLQNYQSELQEAKVQATKLKENLESLQQLNTIIKHPNSNNNYPNNDQSFNYLDEELKSKIKNFGWNLKEFENRYLDLNSANVEMKIEEIIQKCQDISEKMNQFYKEYQILWTQCYYQRLRKQLKSNDFKQEQSDLISYILS